MASDPDTRPDLREFTQAQSESRDPDYLAWRDAKVREALAADKANPEARIPLAEIWKRFGFET